MKVAKYIITFIFVLYTNIVCGQDSLCAKLDSIESLVNSDSFNEDYNAIVQYLKTIESDCLNSDSKLTRIRFLNCFGGALYYAQDYKDCIPVLKNYIKVVEDDHVKDMSSEENLSVYEALGRAQYIIGEIDDAYNTARRAILYFETELDKYPAGYQIYALLSNICEAKGDTVMSEELHHATQKCFIDYWNNTDSSHHAKEVKAAYNAYTEMINLHTDECIKYREIRSNLLKDIALYEEAEFEYKKIIKDVDGESLDKRKLLQGTYLGLFQIYKITNAIEKAISDIVSVKSFFKEYNDKESLRMYAYVLNQYAMLLSNNGIENFNEASKAYEEAIKNCGVDSVKYIIKNNYASLLNNKGVDAIHKNDTQGAKLHLDKAMILCTNEDLLGTIKHNIGRVEMLNENYTKALIFLKESAEIQLRLKGKIAERTEKYINDCNSKL